MNKFMLYVFLLVFMLGCSIDDESPDESVTVRTQYSDGTSDTTTFDYYYKDDEHKESPIDVETKKEVENELSRDD